MRFTSLFVFFSFSRICLDRDTVRQLDPKEPGDTNYKNTSIGLGILKCAANDL